MTNSNVPMRRVFVVGPFRWDNARRPSIRSADQVPSCAAAQELHGQGSPPPNDDATASWRGRVWRRLIPSGIKARRILSHVGTTSNRHCLLTLRIALIVFEALRTFDRPASRAELERESDLGYDQVLNALCTLDRHGLLLKSLDGNRAGSYRLVEGAQKPATSRGRYQRDADHRERMRAAKRVAHDDHIAPRESIGTARVIARGMLDRGATTPQEPFAPCELANVWKSR